MTREDLVDWVKDKGCAQYPLGEFTTGNAIKFVNPKTGGWAYISTPIDDRPITDFIIHEVCSRLGIEVPQCAQEQKALSDHLLERFSRKKK